MDLCTYPILVHKEDIEPNLSFYIQLLGSDWFSDITILGNNAIFGNDGFNSIKYK